MHLLKRILSLPSLFSISLAVGFLIFLLGRFDVDLIAAKNQIRSADISLYLAALVTYYSSFIVRGVRWRIIAANSGIGIDPGTTLPRISVCSLLTVVGWFGNAVTILRVGSAYRAYLFARASNTTFSQSLGIFLAERVVDGVVIFVLMLVAAFILVFLNNISLSGSFLMMSSLIVIIGVSFILLMGRFGLKFGGILPTRLRAQYGRFHRGTIGGLQRLPVLAVLSGVGWILEAARLLLVIQSLGLSLSMPLAMFAAVVNGVLTTIPVTPGGLGVVEPGVAGVLLVSLSPTDAISAAVLDRSISFFSVILIGAILVLFQRFWLVASEASDVGRQRT